MSENYTGVDISKLPAPSVIEQLSFEEIFNEMRDQMNGLQPLLFTHEGSPVMLEAELFTDGNGEQYFRVPVGEETGLMYLELESEPAVKQLQIVAYRELLQRQRINEAALAVMLPYATGTDLDNIAANYNLGRHTIVEGDEDNGIEAEYESDVDFRRRVQLAYEGLSTAGSEGSYMFHALDADPDVKDISVESPEFSLATLDDGVAELLPAGSIVIQCANTVGLTDPMPGDVAITVLSRDGVGMASDELLAAVVDVVGDNDIRPINDCVRERSAAVREYSIEATIYIYDGPDASLVMAESEAGILSFTENSHALGRDITLAGVLSALTVPGVQDVDFNLFESLSSVAKVLPLVCTTRQAAYCTGVTLTFGGVVE